MYNLAYPVYPDQYQVDPVHTLKTCVLGTLNVRERAKKHYARVLQASTIEICGDPTTHPQKETYRGYVNSIGLRACYNEGKRAAETLFFDYDGKHQVRIKIARIFNTLARRGR